MKPKSLFLVGALALLIAAGCSTHKSPTQSINITTDTTTAVDSTRPTDCYGMTIDTTYYAGPNFPVTVHRVIDTTWGWVPCPR